MIYIEELFRRNVFCYIDSRFRRGYKIPIQIWIKFVERARKEIAFYH
jgi:hypothetical protein